jgi:hypothetical protein
MGEGTLLMFSYSEDLGLVVLVHSVLFEDVMGGCGFVSAYIILYDVYSLLIILDSTRCINVQSAHRLVVVFRPERSPHIYIYHEATLLYGRNSSNSCMVLEQLYGSTIQLNHAWMDAIAYFAVTWRHM